MLVNMRHVSFQFASVAPFSAELLSLVYMPSGGRWPRICGCTSA